MKYLVKCVTPFLVPLFLMACESDSNSGTSVSDRSCPAPPEMSDGEIVTYSITYADGMVVYHTFEEVQDNIESGDILHSSSDGQSNSLNLWELCTNAQSALPNEVAFIFFGSRRNSLGTNSNENEVDIAPPVFIDQGCNEVIVTVPAGSYSSTVCMHTANDDSESITQYTYLNGVNASPLSGMLKREVETNDDKVVIELTEWNGL